MAFEYRPFVNPYMGSMTDLMGRGTEARSRAALSAAEAEAGGELRRGDIAGAQWGNLGTLIGEGVQDYVTERREAPIREEEARLRGLNIDVAEQQLAQGARTAAQGVREDEFNEALKARVLAHENPETGEIDYPALIAELRRDFPDLPELVSGVEKTWKDEVAYARDEEQFGRDEIARREQEQRDRARLMGFQGLALASADPTMTDEQLAELAALTRTQMLGEGIDPSKITPEILDPERAAREARGVAATLQQGQMDLEGLRQSGFDRRSQDSGTTESTQDAAFSTASDIARLSRELLGHPGMPASFGIIQSRIPTTWQSTADAEIIRDSLINLLTVENLDLMSGVLSESDVQILKGAATTLSAKMSDEAAREELTRILNAASRAMAVISALSEGVKFDPEKTLLPFLPPDDQTPLRTNSPQVGDVNRTNQIWRGGSDESGNVVFGWWEQ
jgi:hypothetical protein